MSARSERLEDVPEEGATALRDRPLLGTANEPTIFSPTDRDELIELVAAVLEEQLEERWTWTRAATSSCCPVDPSSQHT